MKYKFWLLLVILVLLNGCSATYDLVINEDGSAYEILKSQNYDDYYSKEDILEVAPNFFNDNSDVTYEIDELGNLTITRYKSNYKDLIDDKEINNYLGKIDINSKKISFKPDYDRCVFMFSDGGEYVTDDKIEINVTLPSLI